MGRKSLAAALSATVFAVVAAGHAGEPEALPRAVKAVRELAAQAAVTGNPASVRVESYRTDEFRDSCLGLARAGEACLAILLGGYEVTLAVDGERHTYRTDFSGMVIRRKN